MVQVVMHEKPNVVMANAARCESMKFEDYRETTADHYCAVPCCYDLALGVPTLTAQDDSD